MNLKIKVTLKFVFYHFIYYLFIFYGDLFYYFVLFSA